MGTGSGFGGTVALGTPWWPQVVALGVRRWLWGQVAALGAPWWPQVVAFGGQEMAMGTGGGFGGTLVAPCGGFGGVGRWLWGQAVALGARWPQVVAFGGREMAMGTGGAFGGTVALGTPWWSQVVALGGSGDGYGDRWWLWGQAVAMGHSGPMWWLWGGQKMAMGTGSGFGGTVALGMGRLWVQGGFEDGWRHNPG